MISSTSPDAISFADLGLPKPIINSLTELGYEKPSPIQAESIPILLKGRDLLGQAQTGTGKTAAFALPLLTRLNPEKQHPQLLVLAPTRELAIQVAEAFQRYSRNMNLCVLPVYGGQAYSSQLRPLKRGVQIVVGTPGRIMDHIRRGSLVLNGLQALVLDEADEMLRMGFIDDVEWILEHTPKARQIALFSATMPGAIRKVANTYLCNPAHVKIANKTTTASTIRQRFSLVNHRQKLDAFTRILEVEDCDGILVFVRTKVATVEVADKLMARGYRCQALNGDIAQNQREQTVEKFKRGQYDILVATDVVARGLDIDRISHVVNFDIPLDTESYVHRIGRTGRAGRAGEAILFVTPRERRLLHAIERVTKSKIEPMAVPSADDINQKRIGKFKRQIADTINHQDLDFYQQLVAEYQQEHDNDPAIIAAALAYIAGGGQSLFESEMEFGTHGGSSGDHDFKKHHRKDRDGRREGRKGEGKKREGGKRAFKKAVAPGVDMICYRIEVGHDNGVKPGNIVGAIANEADLESRYIGHIDIRDSYTTVDLPKGMPKAVLNKLKKTWVCGKPIDIKPV